MVRIMNMQDYTEITVTFDGYNVTDKLQVKYNFIKSVYVGRTGDSYRVYYKQENGEKDGGRPYSMNEAAEFISNRFIELVENKIMDKKLEARITRLEKLLSRKNERKQEFSPVEKDAIDSLAALVSALKKAQSDCETARYADELWSDLNWDRIASDLESAESYLPRMPEIGLY